MRAHDNNDRITQPTRMNDIEDPSARHVRSIPDVASHPRPEQTTLSKMRATSDQTQRSPWLATPPPGWIITIAAILAGVLVWRVPDVYDALRRNVHSIALNHAIASSESGQQADTPNTARLATIVLSNPLAQRHVAQRLSYDYLLAWGAKEQAEGDNDAALLWYTWAAERDAQSADALYFVAVAHEALAQPYAARAALQQALERSRFSAIGPSDVYARLAQAETQLEEPVKWENVLAATTTALELGHFAEASYEEVRAHYLLGEALRNLNDAAAALEAYGWVVMNEPTHYWAHLRYGELLWDVDRNRQQAESVLRHALMLDESHPAAYLRLANVLAEADEIDSAIALYQQLLQINPNHTLAKTRLGKLQASAP